LVARADNPVDISAVIANWASKFAVPFDLECAFIFFFNYRETNTFLIDVAEVACSCFVSYIGSKIAFASICVPNLIADLMMSICLLFVIDVSNVLNPSADVSEYF